MSLQPKLTYQIPQQTARVARAAFPKGTLCLALYDHLGTLFEDDDFADLFPRRGQPATAPFRLALVTILQFVEGLSDRAAASAVRGRIDWKYLLCLELDDPGFDYSVLCECRARLLAGGAERRLLDRVLATLREHQLVKTRRRARTDSTHVLAAIRTMNRLERVIEALRATLNALAVVAPEWLPTRVPAEWVERYGARAQEYRLPQDDAERLAYAEQVGADGYRLLDALWSDDTPWGLRERAAVETLRRIWIQNFVPVEGGGATWRDNDPLPPGACYLSSPYDTDARYAKKRDHCWHGYKVHLTESCDEGLPHLITSVHTSTATLRDNDALVAIHEALAHAELLPSIHLVDGGYVEATRLLDSRHHYRVDLFGPVSDNHRKRNQQGAGFDLSCFQVDWQRQRVTCPAGNLSSILRPGLDGHGNDALYATFKREDCSRCRSRSQCTTSVHQRRKITLRPQPLYEALRSARERQKTDEFKAQYQKRAGIEGTLSQGVRAFGLRRCRYRGQNKTRLQHVAIAAAMNVVRIGAWFAGSPLGTTRTSAFARAMAPLMA